ncbi:MAG: hypothetical protein HKN91_14420, partial [Acidimicrobiia bacterium]|nr:hypothetical protein [Acidimicrobiia bacterium]
MGLAHLEWDGVGDGTQRFKLDLGTNQYYRWAVGSGESDERYGMQLMSDTTHVSGLEGPLAERSRGRTVLNIPSEMFDKDGTHVQLMSYRNELMHSPALSNPVRVPTYAGSGRDPEAWLPELAFATDAGSAAPSRYRATPPMSESLFLGAIVSALPKLLPGVGSLVRNVLPQAGEFASNLLNTLRQSGSGGGSDQSPTASTDPASIIRQILEALAGSASPGAAPAPGATTSPAAAAPGQQAQASSYAEAQALPIAALLPLLQSVLTP